MIRLQVLINGGSVSFDLTPTFISATQPSLPLNAYYNTYGLDQDQINAAINTWYDENNDKLIITITGASDALSFAYRIVEQSANFSSVNDTITTNRTFTISALTPGTSYKIQIRGYQFSNGTGEYGNYVVKENIFISKFERLAKITATSDPVAQDTSLTNWEKNTFVDSSSQGTEANTSEQDTFSLDVNDISTIRLQAMQNYYSPAPKTSSANSLASLTNLNKNSNQYAVATRVFHAIGLATYPINDPLYYSFGTTLILDGSIESPGESGGFGFFVNNFGKTGYFVQVDSTKRSADINSKRRVRLFRILDGDKVFISDSQILPETTIDIVEPGKPYKIDVKVRHTGSVAKIDIYVNGFRISIEDLTPLSPTNQMAMFSNIGTVFFDYIYGLKIDENEYNNEQLYNVYSGKLPANYLKSILGDKIFDKNDKQTGDYSQNGWLEDFGKIAREIKKIEVSFSNAPAFPISPSVGINEFAHILGHKTDNFKSEIYVMNNAGFFTPLSDGNVSLVIYGYNIYKSGSLEYKEEGSNEFTKDEPVYFESDWIQKREEVENLAEFLKNQWAKGYVVIDVRVFGGALLSVGDIITINYPYHGLTTSQKFLVQAVNHSYADGGLDTVLNCRSI